MQRRIYLILSIVILSLAVSSQRIYAQSAEEESPKLSAQEESDKREVKKFVDEFMQAFEETNDLNDVPRKFFAYGFKDNFACTDRDGIGFGDELKGFSIDQKFEFKTSLFNLLEMGLFWNADLLAKDDTKSSDTQGDEDISKYLPPDVFETLKTSRVFRRLAEIEKSEGEFSTNSDEMLEASNLLRGAVPVFKHDIDSQLQEWRDRHSEKIKAIRSEFEYYRAEQCSEKDCFGLAERTTIYRQISFPFDFRMVRENGELKVVFIRIAPID